MKKFLLLSSVVLLLFLLFGCFLAPKSAELEPGYYVAFNFQYKASDGAEDITVLPGLKMSEVAENEYKLSIAKSDLSNVLEGKDKDGVYWWTVVKVVDPQATKTWIVYGGTGPYDPSVPFLKEDFDALLDTDKVEFYATIPDSTNTIIGFGDNLKDKRDYYFVGTVTDWSHMKMENMGNGVFEATVTASDYVKNIEYKIWSGDNWDITDTLKVLAFNGKNYYATGDNGTFNFDENVKEFKVIFDAHHSKVSFEPLKSTTIETIANVKERLLADDSATFTTTVRGVVTYTYHNSSQPWKDYAFIQDDTDAIKVYKSGIGDVFSLGDLVLVSGEASVYGHDFEIVPDASELISTGNPDPAPMDITGTFIDDASPLYGKLVVFTGTVESTDTYDNVTFLSDGTEITVKDYVGYDWKTGVEYTVKGVIMWNYDRYKVVPRSVDDITEGIDIPLNGDLSDFPADSAVFNDATNDSQWGADNELKQIKVWNNDSYLYLGIDVSVSGNGWLLVMDLGNDTQGATDLSQMSAWARKITLQGFENDAFVASWNNDDGNRHFYTVEGNTCTEKTHEGKTVGSVTEVKIPWSDLGFASGKPTQIKIAAFVVGGDGSSAPDTMPDIVYPDGWQWDTPITIDGFLTYDVK
ncbi:hypothetical protein HNP65_001166 [Thermosipho japonicus]|uniref:Uncharacterized protein n=1 Tax=Thermosipho japonicus TaxID=90323 RepID=A0A841GNH6_9BACT|nr:hypothetical protein [Thermosipho japonicus]MBB6062714.1 hypothetical protein [Thermosipho japonicus]